MTRKFLPGDELHSWVIVGPTATFGRVKKWLCRCKCGNEAWVQTDNLTSGKSRTCGCSKQNRPIKFGLSREVYSKLRLIVKGAIVRCTNPSYRQWKDYGGRGITVYSEWLENPHKFIQYLTSLPGHDDFGLEIDRTDNNGNYEPGNLRFVTRSESMRNRRNSRLKVCS